MQAVITVATMRESDAYTIANFVPSKTLMYRAAMGVYQAAQWKGPVGILTGGGNNGGDGYALAGILADHGIPCTIYRVSETFSEDGGYYHTQAVEKGCLTRRKPTSPPVTPWWIACWERAFPEKSAGCTGMPFRP